MIGAILARIPVWLWVVAVALGWGAWQRHLATQAHLALRQREAETAAATIQGLKNQIAERDRILKEQQHAGEQGARARDAAEAARLDALGAVGRLQLAASRAATVACPTAPAAAGDGAPGPAAGAGPGPEVLADVLGSLAAAGGRAAAAVDDTRINLAECEQRYDALTRPAP